MITHTKPDQIVRLTLRLNDMFGRPAIVCHHNFSKCALPLDSFTENVSFVQPHLQTEWGEFSLIEAIIVALGQLYGKAGGPDWFVILSGADYPIKPAARILKNLNTHFYDAHIHFESIRYRAYQRDWQRLCYERYCTTKLFSFPFITRRLRTKRRVVRLEHPFLTGPFLPFSKDLRCFAGSLWFSGNRRTAEYIMEFHRNKPELARHYSKLMFADESYFQTILANARHLRVNNNDWRYTDWSGGGAHPKVLLSEDLPKLLSSPAHFARKFDIDADSGILDILDSIIGDSFAW